jgi:D-alanyl-D-alanine carboxypeptidase/D-alanyl-D-alanine-endopeptidase (penicillin-binding protein 4)
MKVLKLVKPTFVCMKYRLFSVLFPILLFFSCSPSKQIAKSAKENILSDESLQTAHVGISIYEPATGRYWYNYQGDKYFVPASNTKLPTCYAAMKYLGDSLVGLRYLDINDSVLFIQPTGDPTFLHLDFINQKSKEFLINKNKQLQIDFSIWKDQALGSGWGWNDYNEYYMAERSWMPIYGNIVIFSGTGNKWSFFPSIKGKIIDEGGSQYLSEVIRERASNTYHIRFNGKVERTLRVPFNTEDPETISELLKDIVKTKVMITANSGIISRQKLNTIHSQPTDSLLKPMMHNSDNFFAEQSLLMVSNELLGVMNDEKIIDSLLTTDFKNLPQRPHWVDGSGLSRYNLFTPQDFVFTLNKMKADFGMDRIKTILPTGDEGTLEGRFAADRNYIFAKTGTLSGVVALSGFLYTKKNKLLIFSVLVNNHRASASQVRSATEKFIHGIREKY